MREDLEYGKSGRFRLKLEDLCYAWALLEEEEKGNLGKLVYVNKVGKITKTERYAALYTRWLIGRLLSGIVSQKRYKYYTALILVKKLKLLSCKKLSIILQKNRDMLTKEKTPLLLAYTPKYSDKDLLKQIELEAIKLAEKFSQKIAPLKQTLCVSIFPSLYSFIFLFFHVSIFLCLQTEKSVCIPT